MSKTNKIHAAVYTALGIILVITVVMLCKGRQERERLEASVENSYDRAFYELTDYVNNIDALLSKVQLASSPAQLASVSNEIFMQAAEAKSCFGELPQEDGHLEGTAKFLSQVGDYTYVLSQNMINGTGITDEEYDTLNSLNEYASTLGAELSELEGRVYNGEVSFKAASGGGGTAAFADSGNIFSSLENVEKSFEGYPSLIYDGPFSEHIESMESEMLKNSPELTAGEALKKAEEFFGTAAEGITVESEMTNTAIEAYNFCKNNDGTRMNISITKRGGYVLYFLENREVTTANYDVRGAIEAAAGFLYEHGFTDMADSYYEVADNIATINFAYTKDGVKMYSDLIKVRVALDDGSIVGMECKGYLMNHRERDVSGIMLSEEEARECVSTHLDVGSTSLAVIPKDSLREVLCYEFKGTYLDKNFIVYINAENGREEEILLLIESDAGILTI